MGGQFIHRFCKYKKSRKMLSRFYAAFARLHKIDPSQTVGIAASKKLKNLEKKRKFFIRTATAFMPCAVKKRSYCNGFYAIAIYGFSAKIFLVV